MTSPLSQPSGVHPVALVPNTRPRPDAERAAELANPQFGVAFTDHMARIDWTAQGGWSGHRVVPFAPLTLHPAASVLHYAQEVFEGLKAYRREDGSVWAFRPFANAERFQRSARRLALPTLPVADFVASLEALVAMDREWLPTAPETSLYLRPYMYASEAFLGVRPAQAVEYLVIASPVGSYFKGGVAPVSIWVETATHRAAQGGTGAAKCGGNYAASMEGQVRAYEHGCEQVLFLDDKSGSNLEELGGMNIFAVFASDDGPFAVTPPAFGTILEGITRSSVIQLLADRSIRVEERALPLPELLAAARLGGLVELFACGTAAVVTPVKRLVGEDFDVTVGDGGPGELTMSLRAELTGIQYGRAEDRHNWTHRLV
jgi:branched-chain amino acid aminotransferase